jgi:hypothetical protein
MLFSPSIALGVSWVKQYVIIMSLTQHGENAQAGVAHLSCFAALRCLDAEQPLQQVKGDFDLNEHIRELTLVTENLQKKSRIVRCVGPDVSVSRTRVPQKDSPT